MFKFALVVVLLAGVAYGVYRLLKSGAVADVKADVATVKADVASDVTAVKADVAAVKAKV